METVSPENFIPENSPWFFDALHSYAVTYANTNFRFDVSYEHGLRDIITMDEALSTIKEGLGAGNLVLAEGGKPEKLYALLQREKLLYTLEIPRTFPEIDKGPDSAVLRDYSISISSNQAGEGVISILGKMQGQGRRDYMKQISIKPGERIFGVLKAPFPPSRPTHYFRSR